MASSSALILVNRILNTTGDYTALASLLSSPAGIANRIVDFFNITISDLEQVSEWPELRGEYNFSGNGVMQTFVYTGTDDIPPNGVGSVWIVGGDLLDELSSNNFDKVLANNASGTIPRYFRRGYDRITNKASVSIFPAPPIGINNIRTTMYRRATKLAVADSPTNTTEFDDGVLVYGALSHMDAYDGLDRGFQVLYEKMKAVAVSANTRNTLKVPLGEYVKWERKMPNAWQDPVFRDSYLKEHPEYIVP